MITTVLVPTDGSEHASRAVAMAADIAGKYESRLVLLYVLTQEIPEGLRHAADIEHVGASGEAPPPGHLAAYPAEVMARVPLKGAAGVPQEVLEFASRPILEAAKDRALSAGATQVEIRAESGDAVEEILRAAEQVKADLIVMGKRGLGPLKKLLVGSVSSKVGQLAGCAILTVG